MYSALKCLRLIGSVLMLNLICVAQTQTGPLPSDERAELLKLIRSLQERVEKLEAAQAASSPTPVATPPVPVPVASPDAEAIRQEQKQNPVSETVENDADEQKSYGKYTP